MQNYNSREDTSIASEEDTKAFIILDSYVLLAATKTGVYRACEEIFKRLILSSEVDTCLITRNSADVSSADEYLNATLPDSDCGIIFGRGAIESIVRTSKNVWLLLPFGVPPIDWQEIPGLKYAHYCYDIIAARKPEFFTHEAAKEVSEIIRWFAKVDLIFAISEYTKKDLLDFSKGRLNGKIVVTQLAADKTKFNREKIQHNSVKPTNFGLGTFDQYILSVGTLEVRKNLDTCIRAYGLLRDAHDFDGKLVLTGKSGWKDERIKSARNSLSARAKQGSYLQASFPILNCRGFTRMLDASYICLNTKDLDYPIRSDGVRLPLFAQTQHPFRK